MPAWRFPRGFAQAYPSKPIRVIVGYTAGGAVDIIARAVSLFQPPPYDLDRDVTPIALVGRVPVVLAVSAQSECTTIEKLIAAAKAQPHAVNYGSPGNGSTPHLAVELFARAAGISLTHVPYKGGTQAITDVIGGHVQVVAVNALEAQPQVRAGATGAHRRKAAR